MKINRKSKEGAIKTLIGLAACLTLALTLGSFALSDVLTPSKSKRSETPAAATSATS